MFGYFTPISYLYYVIKRDNMNNKLNKLNKGKENLLKVLEEAEFRY